MFDWFNGVAPDSIHDWIISIVFYKHTHGRLIRRIIWNVLACEKLEENISCSFPTLS